MTASLMILLFFGGPGSGKGTQAQFLVKEFGVTHVSTGELLRREVASNTSLGQKVAATLAAGDLVSDTIVTTILQERLPELLKQGDLILDGYPRTVGQVRDLDALCKGLPRVKIHVIHFQAEVNTLKERLLRRVTCGACCTDGVLNTKGEFACSFCGSRKFVRRQDDNAQTILARLRQYEKETAPVLDVYLKRGNVTTIDAAPDKETVWRHLQEAVTRLKAGAGE
jgi:adenylate kinase